MTTPRSGSPRRFRTATALWTLIGLFLSYMFVTIAVFAVQKDNWKQEKTTTENIDLSGTDPVTVSRGRPLFCVDSVKCRTDYYHWSTADGDERSAPDDDVEFTDTPVPQQPYVEHTETTNFAGAPVVFRPFGLLADLPAFRPHHYVLHIPADTVTR